MGKPGLLFLPTTHRALAEAINRLLADEPLRQGMAAAALARAQSEFNVDTMTSRMLDLYENVLAKKKP